MRCPKYQLVDGDPDVRIQQNELNNNWMVWGQKYPDSQEKTPGMYACKGLISAIQMAKSISHYNKTGESKAFKAKKSEIKQLKP